MDNGDIMPYCAYAVLGLIMFAFCMISIVDLLKSDSKTDNQKLAWLLLILFTGILGALLYFAFGKGKRDTGGN